MATPHTQPPSPGLLLRRAGRTAASAAAPDHPLQGIVGTHLASPRPAGGSAKATPATAGRGADVPSSQAVGSNLETLNSFTGATHNNTGCCEPPDTQIAVGQTQEVEAVNLTAFVFDRSGNDLGSFDITSLMDFGQANNNGSDPKIIYDAASDRWFMTLMVCQAAACGGNFTTMGVDIAVSLSNNPLGTWEIYQNIFSGNPWNGLAFQDAQGPQYQLQDQPKLGFSADKITITDNVYQNNANGTHCGSGSCFKAEFVTSYQKSDLVAAATAHYYGYSSGYQFDSIPAIPTPFATNTTQFLVWQGFGSLGVNQITGTPNDSNVDNSNTQNPTIGNMTGTVAAYGAPAASGNYIESVAYQSSHLWAVSTDGCTRGTGTVDCTRVDELDTSNASSFTVTLDQDIGDANAFEIYPSITQDCIGNVHWGVTYSNSADNTLPSAADISGVPGTNSYSRNDFLSGDTTYTLGRWGDYSATVQDPFDCGNVWTAQEYGAVGTAGNWATGIGQFSWDVPAIGSVSPSSGSALGGTLVSITGVDFVKNGTSVSFGGTPAASVTVLNSSHIQAVSPAGSGGPVDVTATTANGTSLSGAWDQWSWVPAVTNVSPTAGPAGGGNSIHIVGAGFTGATDVSFGGTTASFTVNSDDIITATAPPHPVGYVNVKVTGPTGTSATSPSDLYKYDPQPKVTSLTPNAGPIAGGNTVTINGTGFVVTGLGVNFGSTASSSVTFVSSSQVKAVAPAHAHGTVDVTVTTPGGTSPTSAGDKYGYGTPTISGLSPDAGPTTGGNTVTVNGTSFVPGSGVHFGSTVSSTVTFVSGTQLKAVVPAHTAGTVNVTVTTAGGTSPTSSGDSYAYGVPTVSSLSPKAGPTAGGNSVTINGTGFVPGSAVHFGSTASGTVTFVSGTKLQAIAPAHTQATVNVTVTTGAGTSAAVSADRYTYDPLPAVTSLSPDNGPSAGGTTVTITGSGFVPGAKVHFGPTASSSVTFVSSTQLKAVAPAHTAGSVNVTVTTPGGTSAPVLGDLYAYGAPTISSFTPSSGATGSTVTINGTGYARGMVVKFGTLASPTVTIVSGIQLKAVVPNGAVPAKISVSDAQGTATSATAFTPTLSITGFSPTTGPAGTLVTINGRGFNSTSTVKFNGVAVAKSNVFHVSSTQLKAKAPSSAASGPITVTNSTAPVGTVRSAASFTVT